jgi:hypothetical protein
MRGGPRFHHNRPMSDTEQVTSRLLTVHRDAPVRRWNGTHWMLLATATVGGLAISFIVTAYMGLSQSPKCGSVMPVGTRHLLQGAYVAVAVVPYVLVLPFRPLGRLLVAASITSSFAMFSLVASYLDPAGFFGPVFCF